MTTTVPYPLGQALAHAQADHTPGTLAGMASATGRVAAALETTPDSLAHSLAGLTGCALSWLDVLGVRDPDQAVSDTYDRADPMDACMSLDPSVPGTTRLTTIIEEIGQVARAISYGHNPDDRRLVATLTEVAALSATWQATQEYPA